MRPAPILFLCLSFFAYRANAGETITDIRFVGNKVTQPRTMLQEMVVHVGDPANPGRIEKSRQAIMNLGLFKNVKTELLPDANGKILQITVIEKFYFLPIPRLNRNADGDISYGAQLRMDNVSGLNQQFRLTADKSRQAGTGIQTKNYSVDYSYPRIHGGPYNFDFSGQDQPDKVTVAPDGVTPVEYNRESRSANFMVSRYLKSGGPSEGWRAGSGMARSEQVYSYVSGPSGLFNDNHATAWTNFVDYTMVQDYVYSREGKSYGYNMQVGIPLLGSDSRFAQHNFYYRQYIPVTSKTHHNLDIQFQLGLSTGFSGPVYSLGGSGNLRGYPRNSIAGRSFLLTNIEYVAPIDGHPAIRGVVFVDAGNTYDGNSSINPFRVRADVGVGLRWRSESFVKFELRLDFAYALNGPSHKIYAGSGQMF